MVIAFFSFFTLIRIVLERMFTYLTKRPFNSQSMFIYIDLATFVTFLVLLGRYFSVYRDGVSAESDSTKRDILFMQNVVNDQSNIDLSGILSVLVGLYWIRIFFLFRVTRILGPLIKIITSMFQDLLTFLTLYSIQLVFFGCVGNLLFLEVDQFSTLYKTMIYLFTSSMGELDFSPFDEVSSKSTEIGHVYYVVFTLINLILLINLLIAILSSTYETLRAKSTGVFLLEILNLVPAKKNCPRYGGLISTTMPMDLIILCLSPLYLVQ